MKRFSWDEQFKTQVACYGPRSEHTLDRVHALSRGGRLLEFGCGEGDLPFALVDGTFSSYLGFDISLVAIERARRKVVDAARDDIAFAQCDMAKWDETDRVSLIVAEECLYYLADADLGKFLLRCSRCLTPEGSLLAIVHSASKHARTLDICRKVCPVRDEERVGNRVFLTLAPATV